MWNAFQEISANIYVPVCSKNYCTIVISSSLENLHTRGFWIPDGFFFTVFLLLTHKNRLLAYCAPNLQGQNPRRGLLVQFFETLWMIHLFFIKRPLLSRRIQLHKIQLAASSSSSYDIIGLPALSRWYWAYRKMRASRKTVTATQQRGYSIFMTAV